MTLKDREIKDKLRTEMNEARKHGLEARHRTRTLGCKYVEKGLCGNEAMDETAPLLLCQRHMALVTEWLMPQVKAWYQAELRATLDVERRVDAS